MKAFTDRFCHTVCTFYETSWEEPRVHDCLVTTRHCRKKPKKKGLEVRTIWKILLRKTTIVLGHIYWMLASARVQQAAHDDTRCR